MSSGFLLQWSMPRSSSERSALDTWGWVCCHEEMQTSTWGVALGAPGGQAGAVRLQEDAGGMVDQSLQVHHSGLRRCQDQERQAAVPSALHLCVLRTPWGR